MAGANGNNTATTTDLLNRLLLSREQVAEVLAVPVGTVENLNRMKVLLAVKVGGRLAWKPETVREYVERLEPGE